MSIHARHVAVVIAAALVLAGPAASIAAGATGATGSTAAAGATGSASLTVEDLRRLGTQAADSTTARSASAELRNYLAGKPDSMFIPYARVMLVQALLACRAPESELLAAIDHAEKSLPDRIDAQVGFYSSLGRALAERGIALDRALHYCSKAVEICPRTDSSRPLLALARESLGQVQLKAGHAADAALTLSKAVVDAPDSQSVLFHLGQAHEQSGKPEAALNAYLRSAAVFGGRDSSALAPLRALWKKQHGSFAGLDARLAAARSASLQHVALDGHRIQAPQPAPQWRLPDLNEKVHELASYKGRVLVMDFWGSWCGPCRQELPLIEATFRRFHDNAKVAFAGINWERAEGAEEHRRLARDYVEKNKLTFPMMYDHEHSAVNAYAVQAFPTVFVIDREGVVRYVNVGFDPAVKEILAAQIESLLN